MKIPRLLGLRLGLALGLVLGAIFLGGAIALEPKILNR